MDNEKSPSIAKTVSISRELFKEIKRIALEREITVKFLVEEKLRELLPPKA